MIKGWNANERDWRKFVIVNTRHPGKAGRNLDVAHENGWEGNNFSHTWNLIRVTRCL
jgi:hypothetical protein